MELPIAPTRQTPLRRAFTAIGTLAVLSGFVSNEFPDRGNLMQWRAAAHLLPKARRATDCGPRHHVPLSYEFTLSAFNQAGFTALPVTGLRTGSPGSGQFSERHCWRYVFAAYFVVFRSGPDP